MHTGLGEPSGPSYRTPRSPAAPTRPPGPLPPPSPPPAPARSARGVITTLVIAVVCAVATFAGIQLLGDDEAGTTNADFRLPQSNAGPVGGSRDLSDVAQRALDSVVSIRADTGGGIAGGSGFLVDDRGHVVTNEHVIDDASDVTVVLHNGDQADAAIVGTEPTRDLAVLQIDPPSGVDPLPLGRSSDVRVGEWVLALGSPLGLDGTVTAGIVSDPSRTVPLGEARVEQPAVQTDASINPGNSGGPLINARGEVIGVNTQIRTDSGGSIGIGFAVPADTVAETAGRVIGR